MSKRLFAVSVAIAALGISASGAVGGSAKAKSCGNVSATVGNIKATGTSCAVAKKVAKADANNKKYDGWKCKGRRINTGASVTCTHKGGGKVTFQIAD